jgi:hypothetical protein
VRDWIIEETRADVRAVDRKYPKLGLRRLLAQAGLVIGPARGEARGEAAVQSVNPSATVR